MTTNDDFIRCRTLGHSWDVVDVASDLTVSIVNLRCISCTTTRRDVLDPDTGTRIKAPRYKHVAGYLRSKDDTDRRPTKDDWRRQFLDIAWLANKESRT